MATGNQEPSVGSMNNRSTPSDQEEAPVDGTPIMPEQPQESHMVRVDEGVGLSTRNVSSSRPNIEGKIVPGIQSSEVAVINQVLLLDEKRTKIFDLPPEIINMIFDCLLDDAKQERWRVELKSDWCTAICLGVVSRRFYTILKRRHPAPLWLSKDIWAYHKDRYDLAPLLKSFMGPRYRMIYMKDLGPLFLNRDIYGDHMSKRERNLRRRWHYYWSIAWWKMSKDEAHRFKPHVHCNTEEGPCMCTKIHILPRPIGMGNSWYKEAVASILETDWNALKAMHNAGHKDPPLIHFQYGILAPLFEFLKLKGVAVIFKNMLGEGWREWIDLMDFPLIWNTRVHIARHLAEQ